MTLEGTVAFVESRERGRQVAQSLDGGPSPGQVDTVLTRRKCRRCGKGGHSGLARDYNIRKTSCDAFSSTCEKCNLVGHFATMCLCNSGEKKPKNRSARKKFSGECMSWHDCCVKLKTMRQGRVATPTPTGVYEPMHYQPVGQRGSSGKPADKPGGNQQAPSLLAIRVNASSTENQTKGDG